MTCNRLGRSHTRSRDLAGLTQAEVQQICNAVKGSVGAVSGNSECRALVEFAVLLKQLLQDHAAALLILIQRLRSARQALRSKQGKLAECIIAVC